MAALTSAGSGGSIGRTMPPPMVAAALRSASKAHCVALSPHHRRPRECRRRQFPWVQVSGPAQR
eukprot:11259876-Alexandrium_andersonii.AAC.1